VSYSIKPLTQIDLGRLEGLSIHLWAALKTSFSSRVSAKVLRLFKMQSSLCVR